MPGSLVQKRDLAIQMTFWDFAVAGPITACMTAWYEVVFKHVSSTVHEILSQIWMPKIPGTKTFTSLVLTSKKSTPKVLSSKGNPSIYVWAHSMKGMQNPPPEHHKSCKIHDVGSQSTTFGYNHLPLTTTNTNPSASQHQWPSTSHHKSIPNSHTHQQATNHHHIINSPRQQHQPLTTCDQPPTNSSTSHQASLPKLLQKLQWHAAQDLLPTWTYEWHWRRRNAWPTWGNGAGNVLDVSRN